MKNLLITAAVLALAACGPNGTIDQNDASSAGNLTTVPDAADQAANTEVVVNGTAVSTPINAPDFVNQAAASDQFEIQSSKIAQAKASGAAVKAYAARMIAEHTKTTADLTAAAANGSPAVVPAPALTPEQRANVAALTSTPAGAAFDKQYVDLQVLSHQNAMATLEGYAVRGDQPMLKAFAAKTVRMVKGHLEEAQVLAK